MLVHAVVGSFTPGKTYFLVMNPDFHFDLSMNIIVCTASGERFSDRFVYDSDSFGGGSVMVWAGICHDGRTRLKMP